MIYGLLIDLKQSRIFYMNLNLLKSILQEIETVLKWTVRRSKSGRY